MAMELSIKSFGGVSKKLITVCAKIFTNENCRELGIGTMKYFPREYFPPMFDFNFTTSGDHVITVGRR
jgi:hypothetical protein